MNSHTPEEARNKHCPIGRRPTEHPHCADAVSGSRDHGDYGITHCHGPDCMWWQWDPHSGEPRIQARTQEEKIAMAKEPPVYTRGYCGAAAR